MATQDRLTTSGAGMQKPRVQGVKAVSDGQRRHEVAPDIADQALHLAFVVALAGTPEPVIEKVMALQFGEHRRAQPLATLHDPRHREAGVVIQDRSRHAAEKTRPRHGRRRRLPRSQPDTL
jgi:hypothetical protein